MEKQKEQNEERWAFFYKCILQQRYSKDNPEKKFSSATRKRLEAQTVAEQAQKTITYKFELTIEEYIFPKEKS